MSIPFQFREEACYRFINSGFKLEETVSWMMDTYNHDTTISRAKYPDKLCANTVTMGGNGDQQQMNIAAFGNAYRRYESEAEARLSELAKAEFTKQNGDLKADNQNLLDKLNTAQKNLNDSQNSIQRHLATINRLDRENVILHLKAGDTIEDTGSAEAAA